jgi:GAF domain-containing protein
MGIPLLSGNEPIGMLSIESKEPFCYTKKHEELGIAFSRQVAPAVFNAKLYKTTQSLLDIILHITEQLDLKVVLRKLARDVVDKEGILGADSAIIYVYDPDHDQVEQNPVCAGLSASAQSSLNNEPSLHSVVHHLLHAKRPRIRTDVRTDPMLYRDFSPRNNVKSVGVFPLRVANKSVGVMFVNYLRPHIFDATEKGLITLIAQKAALAIGHARKYEVARERFEIAKKAAMSLYAMSAWAHDAHKLSYKIDGNVKLLELSLNKHKRDSRIYLERIKLSLKSLFGLPTPPADLDQMQEVNLSRAYEAVRQRHSSELRKKGINVEMNLDNLPDVITNEWLLSEVFHHLTQNAVEVLDKGGTIRLSGYIKESTVYVKFNDNGPGIPQKVLKVLFKRRVPSHKREGSGVGLLLSKMYLNACDGDLTLKHSDQSGTSFVLNLPAAS